MKNDNNKYYKNNGFTLIEVLVALVVLSVGLLGIAALQTKTQQFSRNAYLNTQATVIAHDMLETMRSNRAGLKAGFYNKPSATEHKQCFTLAGCSSEEMAQHDMFEWIKNVAKTLPAGNAVICVDSTHDDGTSVAPACDGIGKTYAVKVWWNNMNANTQRTVTIATF